MSQENKSLIEISIEMRDILAQVASCEGELSPELDHFLTLVSRNLATKSDQYKYVLDRLESDATFWKSKAEECARARRACEGFRERLREAIKESMRIMHVDAIQGEAVRFSLVKTTPSLEVGDIDVVPKKFVLEEVTVRKTLQRDKVLSALADGLKIEGVELRENKALRMSAKRSEK